MKVDQETARKCYEKSLRTRRDTYNIVQVPSSIDRSESELDPRPPTDQGSQPIDELKEIEILSGKKIRIRVDLDQTTETAIRQVLRANMSSFAWSARDMPEIDPNILCPRLNINPQVKPRVQRRQRLNDEKSKVAAEEIKKIDGSRAHKRNTVPGVACQRSHGEESKWEVEDVCRFHRPKPGMPQRLLPFTKHRCLGRSCFRLQFAKLHGCIFRV